ncbi:MAG: transcription antitermination factor NusB [Acidimicrobiales bacterium]|nr:transcription antitermination factor NusB [Acidimicrobiales bacterium]HJL98154.1 transcription antitermination factor NusB [Acidimicrobiales bacterium]
MRSPTSRQVAVQALTEIQTGSRANVVLAAFLGDQGRGLSERDRAFVTELVQGTTRMRRAVDHLLQPFITRKLDTDVLAALRMGAYQLHHLRTPAHAAVNDTVSVAPRRARGLVNAVLRKVADVDPEWPDEATQFSYPDWIWNLFLERWGQEGRASLISMNTPERPLPRFDGYIQGQASRWVSEAVDDASPNGGTIVDLCAAPGGKATACGAAWSKIWANEIDPTRARALSEVVENYRPEIQVVVSDGTNTPFGDGFADAVLVDAPCSGLGALGRRSDARWHISKEAITRLTGTQDALLEEALRILRPSGVLTYSVCTTTQQETCGVTQAFHERHQELRSLELQGSHWRPHCNGGLVLPHDYETDGMAIFQWVREK